MAIVIPNIYTIIAEITAAIASVPGLVDLDTNPSSPTGQQINVLSNSYLSLYQLLNAVYSSSKVQQAQGQQLRDLLALINVYDPGGTQTIIPGVTLTGVNATVILPGSIAATSSGTLFYSANEVTISSGTATVDFYAVNVGPSEAAIGQLNTIFTPVSGWTGVTNPIAGIPGTAALFDSQLRQMQANLINQYSLGYLGAIQSAIYQNSAVIDVLIIENDTDTDFDPPTNVPAHSILIIIYYVDYSQEQAIAESIFRAKWACQSFYNIDGSEVVKEVQDIYGNDFEIGWNIAAEVPIYVIVNVTENSEASNNVITDMTNALVDYVEGNAALGILPAAKIGGTLSWSKMMASVANIDANSTVETFYIGTAPTPTGVIDITADFNQIFTMPSANITINVT